MCFGRHLKNGHHSHNLFSILPNFEFKLEIPNIRLVCTYKFEINWSTNKNLRALTTYLGRTDRLTPGISISPAPLSGGGGQKYHRKRMHSCCNSRWSRIIDYLCHFQLYNPILLCRSRRNRYFYFEIVKYLRYWGKIKQNFTINGKIAYFKLRKQLIRGQDNDGVDRIFYYFPFSLRTNSEIKIYVWETLPHMIVIDVKTYQ